MQKKREKFNEHYNTDKYSSSIKILDPEYHSDKSDTEEVTPTIYNSKDLFDDKVCNRVLSFKLQLDHQYPLANLTFNDIYNILSVLNPKVRYNRI